MRQADAEKDLKEARAALEAEANLASSSAIADPSSQTVPTKLEGKAYIDAARCYMTTAMSSEAAALMHTCFLAIECIRRMLNTMEYKHGFVYSQLHLTLPPSAAFSFRIVP